MTESGRGAPRPRLLAFGFDGAEIELMRAFAGSLAVTTDLTAVHPEEHDVLVLADAQLEDYRFGFPRRLVFAPRALPLEKRPAHPIASSSGVPGGSGMQPAMRMQTQFRPARDFEVSDFTKQQGLEGLVRRSCLPIEGDTYTGFPASASTSYVTALFAQESLKRPLALAALLETDADASTPSSVFWLPAIARRDLAEWMRVALAHWRRSAPESFPETADWHRSERWASFDELSARQELLAFDVEEEARARKAGEVRDSLTASLARAEDDGSRWRALLHDTGQALVDAVQEALEFLGFQVVQADDLPHHRGKKREDLRVIDGEWTAVVEVKGYSGAAKSNDLLQLTSAGAAYAAETSRLPDALWYVPNGFRSIDPSQRPLPLAGRDDDVASFAEAHHGCVIDTRQLFALRQRVALGQLSQQAARETLRGATGSLFVDTPSGQ